VHYGIAAALAALAALALAVLAGCGKPPAPAAADGARAAGTNVITVEVPEPARRSAGEAESAPRGADMAAVESNTAAYVLSADAAARLERALSFRSTNDFTFETISNLVADIPSRVLLDRIVPLYVNNEPDDPRTMALMHIAEVVMLRGQPSADALFARHMVGNFYAFNPSAFPERGKDFGLNVLMEAQLSPGASKAEQQTYVSILLDLTLRLVGRPADRLAYIAKVEHIKKEGVLEIPQQPYGLLPVLKALALLGLNREDEARALLQDLYNQRDQLQPDVYNDIRDGVEAFITNRYYGTSDPEIIRRIKAQNALRAQSANSNH